MQDHPRLNLQQSSSFCEFASL